MSIRVVVTGMGVVSPVGNNLETFWKSISSGTSGIGDVTRFDTTKFSTKIGAEVKDFDPTKVVEAKEAARTDPFILYALYAAKQALSNAKFDIADADPDRCATIIGAGIGGMRYFEVEMAKLIERGPRRVSPFLIPMLIPDMAAGKVSIETGFKGPNYSIVSACATAAHCIGDAFMQIRSGVVDAAICGGTEATITEIGFAGFINMKAMTVRNELGPKASSPFDKKRDGFVMGEGSGILLLESYESAKRRGANILAEVVGYAATGDAYHISSPAPKHEGAARAMRTAIKCAGITPDKIDYINAHGTSTPVNDREETAAIKTVLGEQSAREVSISSTKSMTGHLLGASGGVEAIASIMAIHNDLVPPTINLEDTDEQCDLNYTPNQSVQRKITYAMSNSFGFGGHNASLVFKKFSE